MTASAGEEAPRYLIFDLAGQRMALEQGLVEEIIPSRQVTPAPLVPAFIEGLINLRGRVLTVLRMETIMDLKVPPADGPHMIVLRLPGLGLAFRAGEIVGIHPLATGLLEEVGVAREGQGPPVKAVLQHDGRPVSLLDMDRMVSFLLHYDYQSRG